MDIIIPIICNSNFDLSKFDFSFKGIKILDVKSDLFEDYIKKLQPDFQKANMVFVHDIRTQIQTENEFDKRFAIVKDNPTENFNYSEIQNVWKLLLILFPSDLQIEHEIYYRHEDNFIQRSHMTTWNRHYTGEYPGENLIANDDNIDEVNEYIKLVFERLNNNNYIGIAIENYITSYSASHLHYQYLTLCIALESIINGSQELTYRLKRTIAIICGEDSQNCNIIYSNLNKLYSLRSKIIHGEEYEHNKVSEYIKPLKAIVSRTIIELLIHNIAKNLDLNNKITEIGFGDRLKISDTWKNYKLNEFTIVEIN